MGIAFERDRPGASPEASLQTLALPPRPGEETEDSRRGAERSDPPSTMREYREKYPESERLFVDPATGRTAEEQVALLWPDQRVTGEFEKHQRGIALAETRLAAIEEKMMEVDVGSRQGERMYTRLRRLAIDTQKSLDHHSREILRYGDPETGPDPSAFRQQETERLEAQQYTKFVANVWNKPGFNPGDTSDVAVDAGRQMMDPLRYAMRPGAAPGEVAAINAQMRARQEEGLERAAAQRAAEEAAARAERDRQAEALRERARAGEFRDPGRAMSFNDMELARERVQRIVTEIQDNPLSSLRTPSAGADQQRIQAFSRFSEQALAQGFESLSPTQQTDLVREAGLRARVTEDAARGISPTARGAYDGQRDPTELASELRGRGLVALSSTLGFRLMGEPDQQTNVTSFMAQLPDNLSGLNPDQRQAVLTNLSNGLAWNAQRAGNFSYEQLGGTVAQLDRLGLSPAEKAQFIKPIADQVAKRLERQPTSADLTGAEQLVARIDRLGLPSGAAAELSESLSTAALKVRAAATVAQRGLDGDALTEVVQLTESSSLSTAAKTAVLKEITSKLGAHLAGGASCDYAAVTSVFQAIDRVGLSEQDKLAILRPLAAGVAQNLANPSVQPRYEDFNAFVQELPQSLALTSASGSAAANQQSLLGAMTFNVIDYDQRGVPAQERTNPVRISPGTPLYQEVIDLYRENRQSDGIGLYAKRGENGSYEFTLRSKADGVIAQQFTLENPNAETLREALVVARAALRPQEPAAAPEAAPRGLQL